MLFNNFFCFLKKIKLTVKSNKFSLFCKWIIFDFSGDEEKPFNDFTVYGKDTNYSTFAFQYSHYHFDQLRELMYYNVTQHIDVSNFVN